MPITSGDVSNGGTVYESVASGAGTVTLVSPAVGALGDFGGRICRISVTNQTAATSAVLFYDNASSASGNLIYVLPVGSVATGETAEIQLPFNNGLTISAPAGSASFVITFAF